MNLPSDFDIREIKTILARLKGEAIDDPEDYLDALPTYLEWIVDLHRTRMMLEAELEARHG